METIGLVMLIGYVLYNIYRTLLVVGDALMYQKIGTVKIRRGQLRSRLYAAS